MLWAMTSGILEHSPMRIPRLRFTLRRLMIAVAIVGFALEGGIIGCRWSEYRSLALRNKESEQYALIKMAWYRDHGHERCVTGRMLETVKTAYQADAKYYGFLKLKYEYAMTRPWLPVSPDPPEPE
jgi:hypothetical protein